MRVIGTAGHVDHGKSTLIEALTGIHPDRLQEEREREMTIVLGFAWMTLPNGEDVGIVDVPGHRDFIENMLSGVGAIDAALFVVAADEGVMPQTREHLAILDLLQVQGGVVALTKTDLIDDPEWLELIETDLRETLAGTVLEDAPIVPVSARSGEGLSELLEILGATLSGRPPRPDLGRPRLPVDRVFSMSGFGTVVTGTLTDGHFQVGQDVTVLPHDYRGRIRGLQTHKRKEQAAIPGSRTAINISGINIDQVQRGDVIASPGDYQPSRRLDLSFRMLGAVSQPLRHNTEVKLFIGASVGIARLRLLGKDILKPGEEGWIQLELNEPVVGMRGDRYILRRPSPGETLGGGVVLDAHPKGRHKRFDKQIIERLEALVGGTPDDVLLQAALTLGVATQKEILDRSDLENDIALEALNALLEEKKLIVLGNTNASIRPDTLIASHSYWSQLTIQSDKAIIDYQQTYPLRIGMPREQLKSLLKISPRIFNAVVSVWLSEGVFAETALRLDIPGASPIPVIHKPEHQIQLSGSQQQRVEALLAEFGENPAAPPTIKVCISKIGDELFNAMIDLGYLVPLNSEVVYRREDYDDSVRKVRQMIDIQGSVSVAQVRDQFQTSRRYVLALLEHLDSIGVTVRDGDQRRLK